MKIGLFFGSFNPVHFGHLRIAIEAYEQLDLDAVWFVVSPQNPQKDNKELLDQKLRMHLIHDAIDELFSNEKYNIYNVFHVVDIESKLKPPYYTSNTLKYILNNPYEYQAEEFVLIMGDDSLTHMDSWHEYEYILENFSIAVYPRNNVFGDLRWMMENENLKLKSVKKIDAPLMDVSSSLIRKKIKEGKSVNYLLPESIIYKFKKYNYFGINDHL